MLNKFTQSSASWSLLRYKTEPSYWKLHPAGTKEYFHLKTRTSKDPFCNWSIFDFCLQLSDGQNFAPQAENVKNSWFFLNLFFIYLYSTCIVLFFCAVNCFWAVCNHRWIRSGVLLVIHINGPDPNPPSLFLLPIPFPLYVPPTAHCLSHPFLTPRRQMDQHSTSHHLAFQGC